MCVLMEYFFLDCSIDNCAVCDSSTDVCDECKDGFYLQNGGCTGISYKEMRLLLERINVFSLKCKTLFIWKTIGGIIQ